MTEGSEMEDSMDLDLEDAQMWLPSDVLIDHDEDQLDAADADQEGVSQKILLGEESGGSSPVSEGGSAGTSELLEAALMKLKASEINWKHHQNSHAWNTSYSSSPCFSYSYLDRHAYYQLMHQNPSARLNGWQQPNKPFQRSPPMYHENSFIPEVTVQGTGMTTQSFPETNGFGRECCGTGFFMPMKKRNDSRRKKKTTCSTVFLPYRVIQALNLNIEYLNGKTTTRDLYVMKKDICNVRKNMEGSKSSSKGILSDRTKQTCSAASANEASASDLGLPQDWTY